MSYNNLRLDIDKSPSRKMNGIKKMKCLIYNKISMECIYWIQFLRRNSVNLKFQRWYCSHGVICINKESVLEFYRPYYIIQFLFYLQTNFINIIYETIVDLNWLGVLRQLDFWKWCKCLKKLSKYINFEKLIYINNSCFSDIILLGKNCINVTRFWKRKEIGVISHKFN